MVAPSCAVAATRARLMRDVLLRNGGHLGTTLGSAQTRIWARSHGRICGTKRARTAGRERPPGTEPGRRRRSQRGVAHAPTAITTALHRAAKHAARSPIRAVQPHRATGCGPEGKSDTTRRMPIGATLHEHTRDSRWEAEVVARSPLPPSLPPQHGCIQLPTRGGEIRNLSTRKHPTEIIRSIAGDRREPADIRASRKLGTGEQTRFITR